MKEIWKEIRDYEGIYRISNLGNIYSLYKNRLLSFGDNGRGYRFIYLFKNGKKKRYYIHRLVAVTFIQNPENKPQVNHKDLNKGNNITSNLEWVTLVEQMQHASINGRLVCSELQKIKTSIANSGTKSHLSKLNDSKIIEIRELKKTGITNSKIGLIFGVNRETVGYILRGKTWKHVK